MNKVIWEPHIRPPLRRGDLFIYDGSVFIIDSEGGAVRLSDGLRFSPSSAPARTGSETRFNKGNKITLEAGE